MSLANQRNLAMMAAEDGELHEADAKLSALIEGLEREAGAQGHAGPPADSRQLNDLCQCLLNRASVRSWSVRRAEALQDLARAEQLAEQLKPLSRNSVRLGLLDSRARLLALPHSPVHDMAGAQRAAASLRELAVSCGMAWAADVVDMQLAQHQLDWQSVADHAAAPIAELERLGQQRGAHALRVMAARAWLALGQPARALEPAAAAHAFFEAEGPPDIAAGAALALARARGRPQDWPLAEAALARIEHLTRAQRSLFDQQRYLVEKLRYYDEAICLALDHATSVDPATSPSDRQLAIRRAWQVAEQAKSFSLRQAMTQGGWLRAVDPSSAAGLQALDERLDALEAQGEPSAAQLPLRAELAARRQQLLQVAMQRSPLVATTQAVPDWNLQAVLRALPEGVGVVSWYWLEQPQGWQLNIFHTGADRVERLAQTEWSRDEITQLDATRRAFRVTGPFWVKQLLPSARGDRLMPAAVLGALSGCHTLLMTPHRHLRQLPLHAAQVSDPAAGSGACRLLIEQFAVQLLPTLALPFPADVARPDALNVLLMGCRQDGFKSGPLKDVPLELASLERTWREAGHRVQANALLPHEQPQGPAALAQWPAYDVIHLACHGRFDPASPFDAALYLGSEAVRARDFFSLQLRADVVCLSACDVGQHSDSIDGLALVSDEWLGLALPLFQAGARALLSSLWRADSKTARLFMDSFHGALAAGQSAARAHQQACLAAMRLPFGLWANWQLAAFPSQRAAA
jgi:CHAT domain